MGTILSLVQGQGRTQPCLPPRHLHLHLQIPVQLHLRQPQVLMLQQLPLQRLLPPSPRPRKRPPVLNPLPPRLQQPLRRLPPPPQLLPRFLVQSLILGRAILTAGAFRRHFVDPWASRDRVGRIQVLQVEEWNRRKLQQVLEGEGVGDNGYISDNNLLVCSRTFLL